MAGRGHEHIVASLGSNQAAHDALQGQACAAVGLVERVSSALVWFALTAAAVCKHAEIDGISKNLTLLRTGTQHEYM